MSYLKKKHLFCKIEINSKTITIELFSCYENFRAPCYVLYISPLSGVFFQSIFYFLNRIFWGAVFNFDRILYITFFKWFMPMSISYHLFMAHAYEALVSHLWNFCLIQGHRDFFPQNCKTSRERYKEKNAFYGSVGMIIWFFFFV